MKLLPILFMVIPIVIPHIMQHAINYAELNRLFLSTLYTIHTYMTISF